MLREIREALYDLLKVTEGTTQHSREYSLFKTKLDEAQMWLDRVTASA